MTDARPRILHLRCSNFLGGPEKQILEHLKRLEGAGFAPMLAVFDESGVDDPLKAVALSEGIPCYGLNSSFGFDPRAVWSLASVMRSQRVQLLCTHGYKPNVVGLIVARQFRVPIIAVSRGWTAECPKVRFYEAIDRRVLRHVNHVVAVSNDQRDRLERIGIPTNKISVIRNSVTLEADNLPFSKMIRDELGVGQANPMVFAAGRLSPEKNFAGLIRAAKIVVGLHPDVVFVLFGEGFLRPQLEKLIQDLDLHGKFLLPGFRKDFVSLLPEAAVFIQSSFTEGLPNVVLEAHAARVPVVATDVGGTREVVTHGITGYLVSPNQIDSMAEFIITILRNPEEGRIMGQAGRNFVVDELSFDRQTEFYSGLYRKMLIPTDRGSR